jgi:pimeloyl-ACP methyl ester carboxylesterase
MSKYIPKTVRLADGRRLAYTEYGDAASFPLFFFHGTPGSHIDWELFGVDKTTRRLGIRLIAVDRPGIGLSDFQPGRRFLDWPGDVSALANHLDLARFSLLGYSSGGAYALACALEMPDRLVKVGVLNGDGPYDQPGMVGGLELIVLRLLDLSSRAPGVFRLLLRLAGLAAQRAPGLYQAGFRALLSEPDRVIISQPGPRVALRATLLEALRAGTQGAQWDMALLVEPWDFRPESISTQVSLWVGLADQSTSPAMGRYLAWIIRHNAAKFFPGEGHLSLLHNYGDEILGNLVEG